MDAEPNSQISIMRGESIRRAVLLGLILWVIPSLILASSWSDYLLDLILVLGGPVPHIVNALVLWVCVFGLAYAGRVAWVSRVLHKGRPVSVPVADVVASLSEQTRINLESQGFGSLDEDGLEAVSVGTRSVLRIGTRRELECLRQPDAFRFGVAHEFAHIGSGDPRTEEFLSAAYFAGSLFVIAAIGRIVFFSIADLIELGQLNIELATMWLGNLAGALIPNLVAFGLLIMLFLAERRSSRRLREFRADAIAMSLTGHDLADASAPNQELSRSSRFLSRVFSTHPERVDRSKALHSFRVVLRADQILFLLQSYFSATVLEMSLQLLFVMATPNISTFDVRLQHLVTMMDRTPVTVWAIIGIAFAVIALSQFLIVDRMAQVGREAGSTGLGIRLVGTAMLLAMLGGVFALSSSQAFYWQLSQVGWDIVQWAENEPDRLLLHLAMLSSSAAVSFGAMVTPVVADRLVARLALAFFPSIVLLLVGLAFYG